MDLYSQVSVHPLFSNLHRRAWVLLKQLEDARIFSHIKANYIRLYHLTVAWDPETAKIVDLLHPDYACKCVIQSNQELQHAVYYLAQEIGQGLVNYVDYLPEEILNSPKMAPVLTAFPDLSFTGVTTIVYGNEHSKGIWLPFNKTIAVPPNLYGLPFMSLETVLKTYAIGLYPQAFIGSELIFGCFNILSQEEHAAYTGAVHMMKKVLAGISDESLANLAKKFILGDVDPLLDALEKGHPLSAAMLTFMDPTADKTSKVYVSRMKVIEALRTIK
jgi:hypothetical protein